MTKALARPGWAELSRRDCVAPVSPPQALMAGRRAAIHWPRSAGEFPG